MEHLGTRELITERLRLRVHRDNDAQAVFDNWAKDPEVTRFLRWDPHKDVSETEKYLATCVEKADDPDTYHWLIELKDTGEQIGAIGAHLPSPDHWETGYCMGKKWWNKGYMTEAHAAVVDYMFDRVKLDKLYCCHSKENPASGRVMEKVGFHRVGEGSYTRFNGTVIPSYMYELTKKERAAFKAGEMGE